MKLWTSFLAIAVAQLVSAKPLSKRWDDVAEKHAWAEIPRGWQHKAPAPADYIFEMRIGLKQDGINDLIGNLMETSDPAHAR